MAGTDHPIIQKATRVQASNDAHKCCEHRNEHIFQSQDHAAALEEELERLVSVSMSSNLLVRRRDQTIHHRMCCLNCQT